MNSIIIESRPPHHGGEGLLGIRTAIVCEDAQSALVGWLQTYNLKTGRRPSVKMLMDVLDRMRDMFEQTEKTHLWVDSLTIEGVTMRPGPEGSDHDR